MYKHYYITQSSDTPGNKMFRDGFYHIADQVCYISYQRTPYWKENIKDSLVIKIDKPYTTHCDKFFMINTAFLREDGYVIYSDTSDILFQAPLPIIPKNSSPDVIVCSENITHDGEPNHGSFWRQKVEKGSKYERLMDKNIYNAGLFAMKVPVFKEFLEYFEKTLSKEPVTMYVDQLILNYFLHFKFKGTIAENRDMMMCGYKNIDLGLMRKVDNKWVNNEGKVISICHFCGDTKKHI